MIKTAIIDDENDVLSAISNIILNMKSTENTVELHTFSDTGQIAEEMKNGNTYDIILSDIEMGHTDGLEFGGMVRKNYPDTALIFLTAYAEFAARSYAIDAYQYILKPEMEKRLPEVLYPLIDKLEKEKKQYRFAGSAYDTVKLKYKDIIYIKKQKGSKYVQYITTQGEYRERISFDQLLKELNCGEMIAVDRSYVINMRHIVRVAGNMVYLSNNEEIRISRTRISEVKRQIHDRWK